MKKLNLKIVINFFLILLIGLIVFIVSILYKNTVYTEVSLNEENNICDSMDKDFCETDRDCICTQSKGCFIGNKTYYTQCIDKQGGCEDFCVGWGQEPVRCIENKCSIRY